MSFISDPEKAQEDEPAVVKDHRGWSEWWPASSRLSCEVLQPFRDAESTNTEQFGKLKSWGFQSK